MNLEDFVKLVCARYSKDPSAPSVLISWLEEKQEWYCSIVRYSETFGRGKYVVSRAVDVELSKALGSLAVLHDQAVELNLVEVQLA